MKKRPSIYVGAALEAVLAQQKSATTSTSGIINSLAEFYTEVIRRNMPELSQDEWLAIMDCMNGTATDNLALTLGGIAHNLEDAIELDGLDGKWSISKDLPAAINDLRWEGKAAILDVVKRFWAMSEEGGEKDFDEMLRECGAKVKER